MPKLNGNLTWGDLRKVEPKLKPEFRDLQIVMLERWEAIACALRQVEWNFVVHVPSGAIWHVEVVDEARSRSVAPKWNWIKYFVAHCHLSSTCFVCRRIRMHSNIHLSCQTVREEFQLAFSTSNFSGRHATSAARRRRNIVVPQLQRAEYEKLSIHFNRIKIGGTSATVKWATDSIDLRISLTTPRQFRTLINLLFEIVHCSWHEGNVKEAVLPWHFADRLHSLRNWETHLICGAVRSYGNQFFIHLKIEIIKSFNLCHVNSAKKRKKSNQHQIYF